MSSPSAAQQHPGARIGLVAAVLSAIAFAGSGPFAKPLFEAGWSPGGAVLVRAILCAVLLIPFVVWAVRRDPKVLLRRWGWIVAYGAIPLAATQMFYFLAIERLPVAIALLIEYQAPILLLLATWLITLRRPAWLSLIGAVLAIGGLALIVNPFGTGPLDPLGITYALLAAVSLSLYFLMSANVPEDLPAVALVGGGFAVASVVFAVTGLLGVTPIEVPFENPVEIAGLTVPWWATMAVVVLLGTLSGYLLGIFAAGRLGSRVASFAGVLEVVATMVVAALLLGEIPSIIQTLGAAGIIGGVIAVRLAPDHSRSTAAGGVPDVVGTMTGPIPIPSVSEEWDSPDQDPGHRLR